MPKKKATSTTARKEPPARTPEEREQQMVALAVNLAEQQLRDGTAAPSVITHFLKIGSTRERIEKEILEKQKDLYSAKTKAYESTQDLRVLYERAIDALKNYNGNGDPEDYEEQD